MKKVVADEKINVIGVDAVRKEKYYGVKDDKGRRGFITCNKQCYYAAAANEVTWGNSWIGMKDPYLKTLIRNMINTGYFSIFEFDTSKELFAWIAE